MSDTIDDLRLLSKQVRNASAQGENTAERVGRVMEGTLELIDTSKPDLSKYYTKDQTDTFLLPKWTYDAARAATWDEAAKDKHTHANKSALDLIAYDELKKTWRFTGNIALSGVVSMYADLGDLDIPNIYQGIPIDNITIKRDINGVLFAEGTTGGSFDESSMWTALGTNISIKLIATKYLNFAGYATETYVLEKIQGLGAVFNLKGTKATPTDLPTTGNNIGDVWYVASESVGYIWLTDEKGILRWEKFGEPVDFSAYYTKTEVDTRLATKWTTDQALITNWNDAYSLRHSHSNKAILDGINNTLINNWNSAATNSHTHANKEVIDGITAGLINNWNGAASDRHTHTNKAALDLIVYDVAKKTWRFTGNIALSGVVSMYADLGDLDIPSIYAGLPIDNRTIKRDALGMLYSVSGGGSDFDKTAMWAALASTTTEQINKTHLTDALSTYVLNTDSRLSDSRNAADVYAWAKQPNKPMYSYKEVGAMRAMGRYDTDCNDEIYRVSGSYGTGGNTKNAPVGSSYSSMITASNIDTGLQILGGHTVDNLWFRGWSKHGASYTSWRKIIHEGNWQSIVDGRYLKLSGGLMDGSIRLPNNSAIQNVGGSNILSYDGKATQIGTSLDETIVRQNMTSNGIIQAGSKKYKAIIGSSLTDNQVLFGVSNEGLYGYNAYIRLGVSALEYFNGITYEILHSGNWKPVIDGRYLKLSGGTITGQTYFINGNCISIRNASSQNATGIFWENQAGSTNLTGIGTHTIGDRVIGMFMGWGANPYLVDNSFYVNSNDILYKGDKVWHAGNDGINSGLDSDLWRGLRPDQTNVLSATKLQTLRLIYGQSFNGENNVTGKLTTTSIKLTDVTYDSFRTKGGIVAEGTTIQLGSIKMIVNAATKSIRFEMADGTPCNVVSSGGVVMYGN